MAFPEEPYLGQLHIQHGKLWRWNGLTWGAVTLRLGNSQNTIFEPGEPQELTLEALEARITAIEEALQQSFLLID